MSAPLDECSVSDNILSSMGLGMGGSMKQDIYDDRFTPGDWENGFSTRCFVHLLNSLDYARVTKTLPPHRPFEATDYINAGLPWFDYYSDQSVLEGTEVFKGLKTWKDVHNEPENHASIDDIKHVTALGNGVGQGRPVSTNV